MFYELFRLLNEVTYAVSTVRDREGGGEGGRKGGAEEDGEEGREGGGERPENEGT